MAEDYVSIAEEEGGASVKFRIKSDGTLMLSTIKSIFPAATGLLYRKSADNSIFAVEFIDGRFISDDGWGNHIYWCVFQNKNTNPHPIPVLNKPVPNPGPEKTSSIETSIQEMSHGSNETDGSASPSMTKVDGLETQKTSSSSTSTFLTALSTPIPESMRIDWRRFFIKLGIYKSSPWNHLKED